MINYKNTFKIYDSSPVKVISVDATKAQFVYLLTVC